MHEFPSRPDRVTHFLQNVLQMRRLDMQALSSYQAPFRSVINYSQGPHGTVFLAF